MKVVGIHQPQYLPYPGYFHKIKHCDVFVHLDHVQYQVGGLQNRNKIKSQNGWQWFTLPMNGNPDMRIQDVRIDPRSQWRKKHWNTLQANYARAAHFKAVAETLKPLYLDGDDHQLSSVNQTFSDWAMQQLGISTPTLRSSDLQVDGNSTEMLLSICQKLGATHYLSGPGGRLYMDLELFARNGIEIIWQQYTPLVYEQVMAASGFVENLSVVDMIFSLGDRSGALL